MMKHHLQMVAFFLLASALTACGGGGGSGSLPSTIGTIDTSRTTTAAAITPAIFQPKAAAASYVAIDVGGAATGKWVADSDYTTTGWAGVTTVAHAIDVSNVASPAPQTVYQTQRWAPTLTYTIPNLAPNAAYSVRLHFAETYFSAAGQRVFNVSINGQQSLANFDIFAATGGEYKAIVKQFARKADASGKITIALAATVNNVSLAGVEISAATGTPTPAPTAAPTSTPAPSPTPGVSWRMGINSGGTATGGWLADRDYSMTGWGAAYGVSHAIDLSKTSNPAPQAVYQTQRWAPVITYAIPGLAPGGAYTVRLHLAETFFTASGQRAFNVKINGTQVLTSFDIFKAAGGANSAIVEQFAAHADATGSIAVVLTATVNNASIAGLEIVGGSGSSSPTPAPTPTPVTSPSPTAAPSNDTLPYEFDQEFSSSSPLRTKLSNLAYTVVQKPVSSGVWSRENFTSSQRVVTDMPMYNSSRSGDQLTSIGACSDWSCQMQGKPLYINPSDTVQNCHGTPGTYCDGHFLVMDARNNTEVDCWGGRDGGGQQNNYGPFTVNLANNNLVCAFGGAYTLGTTGLRGTYANESAGNLGSGIAFGPAAGLFMITPYELQRGQINHAIALNAVCLNNNSRGHNDYPANDTGTTDLTCDGSTGYPHYGDAVVFTGQTDAQIAASSRSKACKAVLTAWHDYGAYFSDTGDDVTRLDVLSPDAYTNDPQEMPANVFPSVYADIAAHGDGDNSGNWYNCTNGLSANDFELIQLSPP